MLHCVYFRKELTCDARELKGELYCLPCHDKMGVPICGACRRPIEGRVVNAMGKQWHVEVRCSKTQSPNTLVKMTSKLKFKQMFTGVFSNWLRKYGCVLSVFSTVTVKSSPAFVLPLFYHMCLPHVSSCSTTLFPALLHLAPCVLCVRAPLSGPPILWASWSRLLWETFWHGEGCNSWPGGDCCRRASLLPERLPWHEGCTDT